MAAIAQQSTQEVAGAARRRRFRRVRPEPADLVVETIRLHGESLLRAARSHSVCADDAQDAYQRALEVFVRNASRLDPDSAHRWLHVVVRNEALAVRRARLQLVGCEEADLDHQEARHQAPPEERAERFDELVRAAEALQRLKPQEVAALVLKAQGLSYQEIAERQRWTYTKVNRCLTEGRRAFLQRYAGIQSGEECGRWAALLSALADGEATEAQRVDVRPHLRACAGCRSTLRAMTDAGAPVAALAPPVVAATGGAGATDPTAALLRVWDAIGGAVQERATSSALKLQTAVELAAPGKVAAVAASAAAVAGGGAAAERGVAAREPDRPAVERRAEHRPSPRAPVPAGLVPGPPALPAVPDPGRGAAAAAPAPAPVRRPRPAATARREFAGGSSGTSQAPAQQEFGSPPADETFSRAATPAPGGTTESSTSTAPVASGAGSGTTAGREFGFEGE